MKASEYSDKLSAGNATDKTLYGLLMSYHV